MTMEQVPDVGLRIRAIRERRGISLRALADRCGLSMNAIARIERGENSPTVSSLHSLATALDVPITNFFEEEHELATVFVKRDRRLRSDAHGVVMESLGIGLHNQQLEPFLMVVEPGAGDAAELISHPGEEFVYCLEGDVEYCVGKQLYRLEAGDSLLFKATLPHSFSNMAQTLAILMMVFQSAEGGNLARQRHLGMQDSSYGLILGQEHE
jgi:transcriptional regulator with XRE-family HTH domain